MQTLKDIVRSLDDIGQYLANLLMPKPAPAPVRLDRADRQVIRRPRIRQN